MISRLTLKNFKSIREQRYDFSHFDLLVGRNNSSKSTVLQALAIWRFCIDEFEHAKRGGKRGIQIVLPNFTALPVPEFNLLWTERTDRRYLPPADGKKKKQEYILIEIDLTWIDRDRNEHSFGIHLRYNTPQSVYAIPKTGWAEFRNISEHLPQIVYVPPFSGLDDIEEWRDDGLIRQQVGKAQPGRVLRNLLLRVWERDKQKWQKLQEIIKQWFSIELQIPKYEHGRDTRIVCEYKQGLKTYDIISGGSGFHQTLILLAFLYGYGPDVMLMDEPDAHLHINLQREILSYFKSVGSTPQFLIATHAEEFIRGVQASQIYSLLYQNKQPIRVQSSPEIITAMSDVSNLEISYLAESPLMLYVEGEDDERLLCAWAKILNQDNYLNRFCFHTLRGGSKKDMRDQADRHFKGVKQIIPKAERLIIFDYDSDDTAFHPEQNNPTLYEWQRKNIENYLLVKDAWVRAALKQAAISDSDESFAEEIRSPIHEFFESQNLFCPKNQTWKTLTANIFKVVDGKKILFVQPDSLFQQLQSLTPSVKLPRELVAQNMTAEEIHEDVDRFFEKLKEKVEKITDNSPYAKPLP